MQLDRRQLALLHVAKARLGLTDDEYRSVLLDAGGVRSSKDLALAGFNRVLARFEELGFVSTQRSEHLKKAPGVATPGQQAKIRNMWAEFTDGAGDDRSLGRWLEGRFKVSHPIFLDDKSARKAIAALIDMTKKKLAKA